MRRIKTVCRAMGAAALMAGFLGCADISLINDTGSSDNSSTEKTSVETTFSDSFDSLDSDLYTTVSGTWETEDGDLQETGGGTGILIISDITTGDDCTISADVKSQAESKDAGLLIRYQDEDNYYTLTLNNGKLLLKEKVSGSWTTLESVTCDYSTDSFSTIAVSVTDSTYTAYLEGEEQFSVSDSSLTSGSFGFKTSSNTAYFDDLEVTYYSDEEESEENPTVTDSSFSDSFTYEDSTVDSDYYTEVSGSWEITTDDGEYVLNETGGSTAILILNTVSTDSDATVTVDVKSQDTTKDAGLLARYEDTDNYYILYLDDDLLKLKKKVEGTWTTLASEDCSYSTTEYSQISLTIEDSTLTGYFDGSALISASDSDLTSGYFGLKTSSNTAYFDDFSVEYEEDEDSSDAEYPTDIIPTIATNWKLTLPVDENGDDNTELYLSGGSIDDRNNDAYEVALDDLQDYEYDTYFQVDDGGVRFRGHCAGATTSGSCYPRSELRQEYDGGDNYWSVDDYQYLNTRLKITQTPEQKPEVCFTQIHGPEDEPLRVQYHADYGVYVIWNEDNKDYDNALDYTLGDILDITVTVDTLSDVDEDDDGEDDNITCEITNESTGDSYSRSWTSSDDTGYFKVGCYTQSTVWLSEYKGDDYEDEDIDAYGEVIVYSIELMEDGVTVSD
ncbi:MAG: polysaccharide lyase family 7 protein [Spirochaetales bacterium]|nr:polysaccharide lyase family 7 protein [Spirochaetales bacterium]